MTAAAISLAVLACSSSSDGGGEPAPWNWSVAFEPGRIVLGHAERPFDLVLEVASDSILLLGQDQHQRLSLEQIQAKHLDRSRFDTDHAAEVREALLIGSPPDTVTSLGGWRVLRTLHLLAFKHESWPVALATYGTANGWMAVIEHHGPDQPRILLTNDFVAGR